MYFYIHASVSSFVHPVPLRLPLFFGASLNISLDLPMQLTSLKCPVWQVLNHYIDLNALALLNYLTYCLIHVNFRGKLQGKHITQCEYFIVLFYTVSLHSLCRFVMSVRIISLKRCSSLPTVVCRRAHIYVICACLRIVVLSIYWLYK
jgi:hypothetical protein